MPFATGRTVRKATLPAPVHTPRRNLTDLRRRLAKSIVPRPQKVAVQEAQASLRKPEKETETPMKTKYIKIYTEYEKDDKKVTIIEKKVTL